jgi:hypothetical protein
MAVLEHFLEIIPRHRRALEQLREQKKRDALGGIGWAALRDEEDTFTLEQICAPLLERGLIEDLTGTEMGSNGKFFVRITPLGLLCLGMGYMLKVPRVTTEAEIKKYIEELPKPADGIILNTTPEDNHGRRSGGEDTREQGKEAADARDAHPQDG